MSRLKKHIIKTLCVCVCDEVFMKSSYIKSRTKFMAKCAVRLVSTNYIL